MLLKIILLTALTLNGVTAQVYEPESDQYEPPSYETTTTTSRTRTRKTRSTTTLKSTSVNPLSSTSTIISASISSSSAPSASVSASVSSKPSSVSPSVSISISRPSSAGSISRSSRSSSRRSSPIPSGSVSYINIPGCPPIASTTKTITQTVTGYLATVTSTFSIFAPNATVYDYTTTTSYSYTTVTSYTATVTLDSTNTYSTAETTITQPTAPGFTPVSCNSLYHIPIITSYSTDTVSETWTSGIYTSDPANGFTVTEGGYTYNATETITATTATQSTIYNVVTVTKSSPTSTIWAACATNNIVAEFPYGGYHGRLSPWASSGSQSNPDSVNVEVPASGAVDCCVQCQQNANCSGSAWAIYGLSCLNYIKREDLRDTCDPTEEAEVSYLPNSVPSYQISNSGCGQWHFFNFDSPIS